MSDVLDRLRDADPAVQLNRWTDTPEGRATRDRVLERARPRRAVQPNRPWAALVAAAVVLAIVASVLVARDTGQAPQPAARSFVDGTWKVLPAGPAAGLQKAVLFWTGREVIVWGPPGEDGRGVPAAYNLRTRKWRALDPPVDPSIEPVWTGSELVVWAGRVPNVYPTTLFPSPGAAYDPRRQRWRTIATPPVVPAVRAGVVSKAVWSGREVIVTGAACAPAADCPTDPLSAAAYDPGRDRWRRLPDLPRAVPGGSAAWDGSEVVVAWGDFGDGAAFAYSPRTDAWRVLPDPPPEIVNGELVRTREGVVGVGMSTERVVRGAGAGLTVRPYTLRDDAWRPLTRSIEVPAICQARPTVAAGGVFVSCPNPVMFLDLRTRTWRAMPQPPTLVGETVWTGAELFGTRIEGTRRDLLRYRPGR